MATYWGKFLLLLFPVVTWAARCKRIGCEGCSEIHLIIILHYIFNVKALTEMIIYETFKEYYIQYVIYNLNSILTNLPSLRTHWYLCQLPFSILLFADKCHGLGYNLVSSCQSIGIESGSRTGNGQGWPATVSCLGWQVGKLILGLGSNLISRTTDWRLKTECRKHTTPTSGDLKADGGD